MRRAMTQGEQDEVVVVLRGSKCQDCGNQAKKDCSYSRCRTCCKNKGFQCQTHIKSTWIPVNRSRTRHNPSPHHFHPDIPQTQINPYSGLELKFPAATNSTAIFRCVQVRSMDDAVNEIAYQTSVNIGGHVFSGLLYDQGPDNIRGESSTGLVDLQQNLGAIHTRDSSSGATITTMASAGHGEPLLTPPVPYPFTLRPGMQY